MKGFEKYVKGISDGSIPAGRLTKLAIERHINDLKNGHNTGYYFDKAEAQRCIDFFDYLSLSKGDKAGQSFKLEPWQEFIIGSVFGWKKANGKRRFTEAYVEVAKKNGKTTMSSGIALLGLVADGEPGAEVYAAAYTRDQARICFGEAKEMVLSSEYLQDYIQAYANKLVVGSTASSFGAVSHEARTTEGKNSHVVIFDEYHVHKTDEVKESLRSGMAARTQPLFFIITTAGTDLTSPCYDYRRNLVNMLEGKVNYEDTFAIIYNMDDGDDWKDPKNWHKSNPNLNVSVQLDFLLSDFKKAEIGGSKEADFKTKHLNCWVGSAETWIKNDDWIKCINTKPVEVQTWYGGLDLANTKDYTAFSLFGLASNGKYRLKTWYWICEAQFDERAAKMPDLYRWREKGLVKVIPGNVIDKAYVVNDIRDILTKHNVHSIGYDRYGFDSPMIQLQQELGLIDGTDTFRLCEFNQSTRSMSAPSKQFEVEVMKGNLEHDGNEITTWMLGNVLLRTDAEGNYKPDKARSNEKIDGVVASIMALGQYLTFNFEPSEAPSIYETEEVFFF